MKRPWIRFSVPFALASAALAFGQSVELRVPTNKPASIPTTRPVTTAPAAPAPTAALTTPAVSGPSVELPRWESTAATSQPTAPGTLPTRPPRVATAEPTATMPAEDLFQSALYEEESNLNLDAALGSYQAIIAQFDRQRPTVANAMFRLGECYRKLGHLEEAKIQYARILREFPDQVQLARLSQQYLFTGRPVRAENPFGRLGLPRPAVPGPSVYPGSPPAVEPGSEAIAPTPNAGPPIYVARTNLPTTMALMPFSSAKLLASLLQLQPEALRQALPTAVPDTILTDLLTKYNSTEQELATLRKDFSDEHPQVVRLKELLHTINTQIDARVRGIVAGLQTQSEVQATADKTAAQQLEDVKTKDELQQLQTELAEARARAQRDRFLYQELRQNLNACRNLNPINLPAPGNNDPRYQKLKQHYEGLLLGTEFAGAPETRDQQLRLAIERIQKWVQQIYFPEQEAALKVAEEKWAVSEKDQRQIEDHLDQLRAIQEKARASAPSRVGHRVGQAQYFGKVQGVLKLEPLGFQSLTDILAPGTTDPGGSKSEPGKVKTVTDGILELGFDESANLNLKEVRVSRVDPQTRTSRTIVVNVKAVLAGDRSKDLPLQDGDRVEVRERMLK